MNRQLKEENAQLRFQLGLPTAKIDDEFMESSDEEQDSGGAETYQETAVQITKSSDASNKNKEEAHRTLKLLAQSQKDETRARPPFTAYSASLCSVLLEPLD